MPGMCPVNELGQVVGEPVAWAPRSAPVPVRLSGRYVVVEPVATEHAEALFEATRDPALWTYRTDDPPTSAEELSRRIEGWAGAADAITFALVPSDSGRAAGVSTLCRLDPANGSAEIGNVLLGTGLARTRAGTEALRLFAGYLFEDLGYRRFEWKLDSGNAPSAAAARRSGFGYEGRFRNALVYKGRNRDTDWFAMTDADWTRLAPAYDAWLDPANFDGEGQQRTRLSELVASALGHGGGMDPRVSFITLAVSDLGRSRRFYVDGLGWAPVLEADDVLMFRVADKLILSLWSQEGFEEEVGPVREGTGIVPVTLAHNVATPEEVDRVLAEARDAGAGEVGDGEERVWGGYTGYFADPDGFRWEIAYNPGELGQTVLP